jgi:hypothetical protein
MMCQDALCYHDNIMLPFKNISLLLTIISYSHAGESVCSILEYRFYIPRSTMSGILDKLTEEEISELAIPISRKNVDIALLLRGEFTVQSFLNIIENWSRLASFPYKHEVDDDTHNFLIQHDMGKKYSIFLKEIYKNILQEKFQRKLEFTITDNTVVLRFRQ